MNALLLATLACGVAAMEQEAVSIEASAEYQQIKAEMEKISGWIREAQKGPSALIETEGSDWIEKTPVEALIQTGAVQEFTVEAEAEISAEAEFEQQMQMEEQLAQEAANEIPFKYRFMIGNTKASPPVTDKKLEEKLSEVAKTAGGNNETRHSTRTSVMKALSHTPKGRKMIRQQRLKNQVELTKTKEGREKLMQTPEGQAILMHTIEGKELMRQARMLGLNLNEKHTRRCTSFEIDQPPAMTKAVNLLHKTKRNMDPLTNATIKFVPNKVYPRKVLEKVDYLTCVHTCQQDGGCRQIVYDKAGSRCTQYHVVIVEENAIKLASVGTQAKGTKFMAASCWSLKRQDPIPRENHGVRIE